MARFFGTNGIRGIFPGDLTPEFIRDMTLAIATHFGGGPVLVGRDGRASSPQVSETICAALGIVGLDCNDAGLVPTPCLEYAVKARGYAGGIMVTASHNPSEYNGIKPVAADGVEISREDELVIEDIFLQRRWRTGTGRTGRMGREDGAIPAYMDAVTSQVDSGTIRSRKFTVVLDLGNGAQAVSAPAISEALGCRTILVNSEVDGRFPGRGPEPTPQNLDGLSDAVVQSGADMGVAFDGDGDRSLFCDDTGTVLTGDKSALLLSDSLLAGNHNSTIVTCLNSGSSIERIAKRHDSDVIRTKVGSVEVSRMMVSEGALAGFEENGGFMLGRHNPVRDGAMTMALMLDLLASSTARLSEMIQRLPESYTTKDKMACNQSQSRLLIESLAAEFPEADTTDGIKISTATGEWVMVRPSGTEPIVRIYAESGSQAQLDRVMERFMQKARAIISD